MATVLEFLGQLPADGSTDLVRSLREFAGRNQSPGLVVVISDLLGIDGAQAGFDAVRHRGHDLVVVQLLAEEEIEPVLDGALNLVDAEDHSELKVTVDAHLRELYQAHLRVALGEVEQYCRRLGVEYLRASTAIPFDDLVLRYLRQGRVWR